MTTTTTPSRLDKLQNIVPAVSPAVAAKPRMSIAVVTTQSAQRQALETEIRRKFERVYGAQLRHFLPKLLHLQRSGKLGAAVGIRSAGESSLFLEQYTDRPIEQFIAGAYQLPVDRDQVVEIGNLTAVVPGIAYTLFALLATLLTEAGFRWVTCTATPQVEAMLARMQFSYRTICSADPACLSEGSANWGDYYKSRPNVIVGNTREAAAQVASHPDMAALLRQFAGPISRIASQLKSDRA